MESAGELGSGGPTQEAKGEWSLDTGKDPSRGGLRAGSSWQQLWAVLALLSMQSDARGRGLT